MVSAAGVAANEPSPGSRVTEDGETLRWSMLMMGDESPATAPFFIQWGPATRHPSLNSPIGCSLTSFTVSSVDHENLERLLTAVGFTASVVTGPTRWAISLDTPRGAVTIGG